MNNEEINKRILDLELEIKKLKSFTTIPFDTEKAFRNRLGVDSIAKLVTSAKIASSENQTVNESGSSTYTVLKSPDAFLQTTIDGVVLYIPIYT